MKHKSILITGGTGTLGKELVNQLLKTKEYNKIVVFSRDEQKHFTMSMTYPSLRIRYHIGDIRNLDRLKLAMKGIDYVIHAAAQKHVALSEYNPGECILTNIVGTLNVITACNEMGIKKCILVSTDKSVKPINLYGATKAVAEKVFNNGNNLGSCRFSICRYGNVEGSKGSVIEKWCKRIKEGLPLQVTDKRMTRFWITLPAAASFILSRFLPMRGGEIFIPEITKSNIYETAKKLSDNIIITKPVPGEKIHESLINEYEIDRCFKLANGYVIYPEIQDKRWDWHRSIKRTGEKVKDMSYYLSSKGESNE